MPFWRFDNAGQHAVADPARAGRRDRRNQPLEQLEGLEHDVSGAVAPVELEPAEQPPLEFTAWGRPY